MPKILVVDDSLVIRKMLVKSLEESQYEVLQAENGQEGLDLFTIHHCDLLITDINMPILNGLQLISKIRQTDRGKSVPIIVLSTEFSDDIKQQGKDLNVKAWMVKPAQEDTLKEVVTALLTK